MKAGNQFRRPIFGGICEFCSEVGYPFRHRDELRAAFDDEMLSPAFRERLMLAVTGVNDCPYCTWQHTRMGLKEGLTTDEVRAYLGGEFSSAPADELPALLYAQHWAEQRRHPDPELKQRIVDTYGADKARAIHAVLRMIWMGNLLGNTWDYVLYRISFGRWGSNCR